MAEGNSAADDNVEHKEQKPNQQRKKLLEGLSLSSNKPLGKRSRRSVLRYMGAGSTVTLSIPFIGAANQDLKKRVDILEIIYSDLSKRYVNVPESWFAHVRNARNTVKYVKDEFGGEDWYGSVGQQASDNIMFELNPDDDLQSRGIEDLKKHQICVGSHDINSAKDALPDQINNIDIVIDEFKEIVDGSHGSGCDCNTTPYQCLEGGTKTSVQNTNKCVSHSTHAQYDSSYYMITTAHQFNDYCSGDITGETATNGSDIIGDVDEYNYDYDYALIDDSDREINGIDNTVYDDSRILSGHLSENAVDLHISSNMDTHHYGPATCYTSDEIQIKEHRDNSSCPGNDVWWIRTETEAQGGDSGAPHYWIDDEENELSLYGIHKGHITHSEYNYFQYSIMPAAFDIHNNDGVVFGSTVLSC